MTFTDDQIADLADAIAGPNAPLLMKPEHYPKWYRELSEEDQAEAMRLCTERSARILDELFRQGGW